MNITTKVSATLIKMRRALLILPCFAMIIASAFSYGLCPINSKNYAFIKFVLLLFLCLRFNESFFVFRFSKMANRLLFEHQFVEANACYRQAMNVYLSSRVSEVCELLRFALLRYVFCVLCVVELRSRRSIVRQSWLVSEKCILILSTALRAVCSTTSRQWAPSCCATR